MSKIEIFTDGACRGNPGKGGWGVLIRNSGKEDCIFGGELDTTNNIMELTAAIKAITSFKKKTEINIYTDSKYLKEGITIWIKKWKINKWKTSNKNDVKNSDLWKELDKKTNLHIINWFWVKA